MGQTGQQRFEESVPSAVRYAVEELEKIETTAEWAKTQATKQGIHTVARASDDIKNIAQLQKDLLIRQSPVAQTFSQCASQSFQQSIQELQQGQQLPGVQQLSSQVQTSLQNVQQAVQQVGQMGGQQRGQFGGQQAGGQSVGQQY